MSKTISRPNTSVAGPWMPLLLSRVKENAAALDKAWDTGNHKAKQAELAEAVSVYAKKVILNPQGYAIRRMATVTGLKPQDIRQLLVESEQ